VLQLATNEDSIILDSFAGSGTTAHAVLSLNHKDGGNRRFILVECEDYADTLTAERVRRVINGYEFQGSQRKELLRVKITLTTLKKAKDLMREVHVIEELNTPRFDAITKTVKDGELVVTGENKITERLEGLGGGFTYYTLGDPLDLDKLLTGEHLPSYVDMGAWLFHTATGEPLDMEGVDEANWRLGESKSYHVWLVYKPDLDFLKSGEAALTLSMAEKFRQTYPDKRHLVFAPARYAPNKMLAPLEVEHAPLPFALYRFEQD
jgi:adenine-specific DNA-methyltransferase